MIILRVWIDVYCAWTFYFYNFFFILSVSHRFAKISKKFFVKKPYFSRPKIFVLVKISKKSSNFVIFGFFNKIRFNSCKVYLKHTLKLFLDFFGHFRQQSEGQNTIVIFTLFCFQALVHFGENFPKSSNFVIFLFFYKICFNLCKVYLKHAPKIFFKYFGHFLQ